MRRSLYCAQVTEDNLREHLILQGWVQRQRDLGGVIFIDLRDRSGIMQIVFDPKDCCLELMEEAKAIRSEYVIEVEGTLRKRSNPNPNIPTGYLEVLASKLEVLNTAETTPFIISDDTDAKEDLRLTYRYLDLRRPSLQHSIRFRHEVVKAMREFLWDEGFIEIETPMFIRSTPEGARDFLVPSRNYPGRFYALPQSPQLFKQLSMIAGFDKYFQLARCFRDEASRSDRQPEFTQLDIEMSFVDEEDVYALTERLMKHVFKTCLEKEIETPFKRIPYNEALSRYGTDKPDIRFELEIKNFTTVFKDSSFPVFQGILNEGGFIKGIDIIDNGSFSRKQVDEIQTWIRDMEKEFRHKETGAIYLKRQGNEYSGTIKKYLNEEETRGLNEIINDGEIAFIIAGKEVEVDMQLGVLRNYFAKRQELVKKDDFRFCWIIDFPLFKWNEEENRLDTEHHPFTQPNKEDYEMGYVSTDKEKALMCRGRCYDLVLNGVELSSGSIRNHKLNIQYDILNAIGMSKEEADRRFGFLLEALRYGAPPHGGIAPGLDRIVMLMLGLDSLRDVYAFPKTSTGLCLMTKAPAEVDKEQLDELGIAIKPKE